MSASHREWRVALAAVIGSPCINRNMPTLWELLESSTRISEHQGMILPQHIPRIVWTRVLFSWFSTEEQFYLISGDLPAQWTSRKSAVLDWETAGYYPGLGILPDAGIHDACIGTCLCSHFSRSASEGGIGYISDYLFGIIHSLDVWSILVCHYNL